MIILMGVGVKTLLKIVIEEEMCKCYASDPFRELQNPGVVPTVSTGCRHISVISENPKICGHMANHGFEPGFTAWDIFILASLRRFFFLAFLITYNLAEDTEKKKNDPTVWSHANNKIARHRDATCDTSNFYRRNWSTETIFKFLCLNECSYKLWKSEAAMTHYSLGSILIVSCFEVWVFNRKFEVAGLINHHSHRSLVHVKVRRRSWVAAIRLKIRWWKAAI